MKRSAEVYLFGLIFILLPFYTFAKKYKGAEFRTIESFLYGRFEVQYKVFAGNGHVSTFFTYHEITSTANWNEIDIEIHGRYTDNVQVTTITPHQKIHLRHQFVDFNPHIDFHSYAFEWTPDYVAWFIDGEEVCRQTEEHIATLMRPQKIMMNIWNPEYENWVGAWDDRILPRFAYYDYVTFASYTPGSGDLGTDNNFTLQWLDNFDSWDQRRWEKAVHTFPGNNCDFTPENVVFRDGLMILCLTDNANLGFQDKNPPAMLWAKANKNKVSTRFSEELDKSSAEKKSNYIISGVSIENASLLDNERTVELAVSGMELNNSYNLTALRVQDKSLLKNSLLGQTIKIEMPCPLHFPIKINVGGDKVNDYLPDQEWGADVEYGYLDGQAGIKSPIQPIAGTEEDEIYRSEKYGLVNYKVRVPNGKYKVTLIMMSENDFSEPNKRYFDIYVEGHQAAKRLDLYQKVGLPQDIIQRSRELVGEQKNKLEDLLVELETKIQKYTQLTREVDIKETELRGLTKLYKERTEALKKNERELKKQAIEESEEILRQANAAVEREIREIREREAEREAIKKSKALLQAERAKIEHQKQEIEDQLEETTVTDVVGTPISVGDRVRWQKTNSIATVLSEVDKLGKVLLQAEGDRVRVPVDELVKIGKETKQRRGGVSIKVETRTGSAVEVDLRGLRAEEAQDKVEKFLDDAALNGLGEVRIIHGKGTGRLRAAIGQFLNGHPHVRSTHLGNWNERDTGVTIVELKEE